MRKLILALMFSALALAQSTLILFPLSDITGSGATVALSTSGTARFCQLIALPTNAAAIRLGDASTTISRGAAIAPGGGQFIPPSPGQNSAAPVFQLNAVFVYIANGDKLTVTCWR
jgi:hypothetical protein